MTTIDKISSSFGSGNETREHFVVIGPEHRGTFDDQINSVFGRYRAELNRLGVNIGSAVTATAFLSDSANQEADLRKHPAFRRLAATGTAITVVEQPPICSNGVGGKIGLSAYHVVRHADEVRTPFPILGTRPGSVGLRVEAGPYRFSYMANLLSSEGGTAADQAHHLLGTPGEGVQSGGLTLHDINRTWIHISNLDVNYPDISRARNGDFAAVGIDQATGFPASTGIAGRSADHGDLMMLGALAVQGLQPGQNRRMEALTHMNRTVEYGVTFERGRELVYGDRRHLYVSGTASISNRGDILHVGDVVRQTGRAVENVEALLAGSDAGLTDLRYLLVYLRDASDAVAVEGVLAAGPLAGVPRILLHAAVCRPGWLVEVEGVAIDGRGDSRFAPF